MRAAASATHFANCLLVLCGLFVNFCCVPNNQITLSITQFFTALQFIIYYYNSIKLYKVAMSSSIMVYLVFTKMLREVKSKNSKYRTLFSQLSLQSFLFVLHIINFSVSKLGDLTIQTLSPVTINFHCLFHIAIWQLTI